MNIITIDTGNTSADFKAGDAARHVGLGWVRVIEVGKFVVTVENCMGLREVTFPSLMVPLRTEEPTRD